MREVFLLIYFIDHVQCSTFTGMIPVFGVLLILFEWYWYVVCESGIRTSLILLGATAGSAPQKANHICSIHLGAFSRQEFAEAWNAADEPAQQPQHDGASSRLAKAKCCLAWKVGGYPGGADRRIVAGHQLQYSWASHQ